MRQHPTGLMLNLEMRIINSDHCAFSIYKIEPLGNYIVKQECWVTGNGACVSLYETVVRMAVEWFEIILTCLLG